MKGKKALRNKPTDRYQVWLPHFQQPGRDDKLINTGLNQHWSHGTFKYSGRFVSELFAFHLRHRLKSCDRDGLAVPVTRKNSAKSPGVELKTHRTISTEPPVANDDDDNVEGGGEDGDEDGNA